MLEVLQLLCQDDGEVCNLVTVQGHFEGKHRTEDESKQRYKVYGRRSRSSKFIYSTGRVGIETSTASCRCALDSPVVELQAPALHAQSLAPAAAQGQRVGQSPRLHAKGDWLVKCNLHTL